jgi:hypothetical protein
MTFFMKISFAAILASAALAMYPAHGAQFTWIRDTKSQVETQLPVAHQAPPGQALVALARQMRGRPYTAFSLDSGSTEELRLDLTAFDCVLFVEQLLALIHSRTVADYPQRVLQLRYRDGQPDYCLRHHYFSLWAKNAQALGMLTDITPTLPGVSYRVRSLSFMSSHPGSYLPMKQARSLQCITENERTLMVRQDYIPLSSLPKVAAKLQSGDIFSFVTSIPGLDVTHTGILERTSLGLNALHAIPEKGVVRTKNFLQYASAVEDVLGVSIYRPRPAIR